MRDDNYEEAHNFADHNRQALITALPRELLTKEERFLDQVTRAKTSPARKLEILFGFMEELSRQTSKFMACKKGCSACCYYKISISEMEIEYIERNTKHRRNKVLLQEGTYHGTPCPFLLNGSCSIYHARPFVCRRHHSLAPSAYWCHPDRSDRPFPMIGFTNIDGAFDHIRRLTNAGPPRDIRQVFTLGRMPSTSSILSPVATDAGRAPKDRLKAC